MTLLQKLKEEGWHLTEDGLKKLTSDLKTEDVKKIIAAALNWDLKDIGGGALPIKPESNGNIMGRIILQMQKMRNISAPKANEESTAAPRFLQLELSDGVTSIQALELERIPNLNLNVAPGTKFYFKSEKVQMVQGFLVLKAAEVQILGGRVEHLAEKWEVARQLLKYAKSNRRLSGAGAPPSWVAFEKRMDLPKETLTLDRNFKSLQAASGDKEKKENDEFNNSRSQAIAEAVKTGKKKVFGGGQQNMLDHNVKKILEKGYLEDEATMALKATHNNLERALYSLKKKYNRNGAEGSGRPSTSGASDGSNMRGGQRERGRGSATAKEEASASKPQGNVSLFDFLTAKIPLATPSTTSVQTASQPQSSANTSQTLKPNREHKNPFRTNEPHISSNQNKETKDSKGFGKFENNMSSSFAANRVSNPRSDDKYDKYSSNHSQSQRSNFNQREERTRSNAPNKQSQRGNDRSRASQEKSVISVSSRASSEKPVNSLPTAATGKENGPPQNGNISSSNSNNQNSVQSSSYISNSNRRNDRNDRGPRKEREQTPRQSVGNSAGGGYQGNKRNQEFKPNDNKPYQQRDNNTRGKNENKNYNNPVHASDQSKTNNNFENTMEKLTESTSKMSIQNKKESSYNNSQGRGRNQGGGGSTRNSNHGTAHGKPNNSQQQTSQFISSQNFTNKSQASSKAVASANATSPQQQQPSHTFVSQQLPNGYSYDPSKIIGFQSKEANEYAMNLLKSQGLLSQQSAGATAPQSPMPPPPQHQPQIINNPQAAPPTAVAFMPPNPNVYVATPQASNAQYGMMPSSTWPWNIGDLCLAKYWEDGNYYDAKITAVSENTCVVLYMGYGNYEEVLKADCLPIADASHLPLNAFQAGPPPPPGPMQQPLTHTYQGANTAGGGGAGGNQRYRTERQMYVPPPKRGNPNNN